MSKDLFRVKIEKNNQPIVDTKTQKLEDLENIFDTIKRKLK